METSPVATLHIGVINPFALAELKLGRAIDWSRVSNPRAVLEQLLGKPYRQLFDPKYGSPLYPGLRYDEERKTVVRDETDPFFTADSMELALVSVLRRTGDILEVEEQSRSAKLSPRPRSAELFPGGKVQADSDLPLQELERIKRTSARGISDVSLVVNPGLIDLLLGGFDWSDPGHFFTDATRPIDVIQGSLADCYFLAALASVAWARPYAIVQRTRPIDTTGLFPAPGVVDLVLFWNGSSWDRVEVTELLPLQPPLDGYVYARSDDPQETWSAIYEKAYAMWRTGDSGDYPNYTPIAYGDTVLAASVLTGLPRSYYSTNGVAAHDLWQAVRAHSLSFKTFDPMMAWTYPSSAYAPTPIDYGSAHIVANHAYSILGWDYENGQEYIVLRNPWGTYEATLDVEGGYWYSYDGSFWRPVPLGSQGIFALRADIFQQYFAGYGVVTGTETIPES